MKKIKEKRSYLFVIAMIMLPFLFNGTAFANETTSAGVVISSDGTVTAIAPDKSKRELSRGALFYSSETIIVGDDSTAQLKFSDDTLFSLLPATEFRIDSYSFKEANQEDESATSLVTGGFRMLSGSIAKTNPSQVTITTPVATIGIRGTSLDAFLSSNTLFASCTLGEVEIKNSQGITKIGPSFNQFASVERNKNPKSFPDRPAGLPSELFSSLEKPTQESNTLKRSKETTPFNNTTPGHGSTNRRGKP